MPGHNRELGAAGEQLAERHLRRQGYTIVERNFRCLLGEVDLIALDRSTVVFIEVKTRESAEPANPLEAVDRRKQRQIARVAQYYLRRNRLLDRAVRFDVIAVSRRGGVPSVDLVRDAFQPSGGSF